MTLLICIVSRCAWTFHNFRLDLAKSVATIPGVSVLAAGVDVAPYGQMIEASGIRFERLRGTVHGQNPLRIATFMFDLLRLYLSAKPEVVHHFTVKPVIFGTLAARVAGVPTIINTITGLGRAFSDDWSCTSLFARFLYRISLSFSTHVFFQNEDDRHLFVDRGLVDQTKTSVVPGSGVNLRKFTPALKDSGSGDAKHPQVLMVSRMLTTKGVQEFVAAAEILRSSFPNTRFLLLGGLDFGNPAAIAREDLERWQRSGVVTWIEHQDDVRPMMANADIVVLPSYYREGVPRTLLEAAAMSKPIVTTDNIGCREVVQHGANGLLVPPRDPTALAEAIASLLRNPSLRDAMGATGRRKMIDYFDQERIIERTIDAYAICKDCHSTTDRPASSAIG